MSALATYRVGIDGPFDFARARRLATRAGFGATLDELQRMTELGLDGAIDELSRTPEPDPTASPETYEPADGAEFARAWWLQRMLSGRGALRERLTLLWHDHFATSLDTVRDLGLVLRQNEILRWNGDGPFGHLLQRVVLDAAMTMYLDGNLNQRGNPNENLAREILELFSLGHGNYTQADVRELARALTGWSVEVQQARFSPDDHDDGTKTILGHGERFDAPSALAVVTDSPACARFISATLWRAFVGEPDSPELRAELADEFVRLDLHVGRFVDLILRSRGFLGPDELAPRNPAPVELVCRMARSLGIDADAKGLADLAGRMGQYLFAPPSVAGWPQDLGWSSTTWCLRRIELPFLLLRNGAPQMPPDSSPAEFVRRAFASTSTALLAIDSAEKRLGSHPFEVQLACLLALPEVQWI